MLGPMSMHMHSAAVEDGRRHTDEHRSHGAGRWPSALVSQLWKACDRPENVTRAGIQRKMPVGRQRRRLISRKLYHRPHQKRGTIVSSA